MEASNVTNALFNQLNFRGERQKIISSNIANINTPNYKTKELVFENELDKVQAPMLKLAQTNGAHLPTISNMNHSANPRVLEVKGLEEQNDGNNVNLDTQMGEMSKNKVIFDAIQSSIRKDSRLMRSVVESSAKN